MPADAKPRGFAAMSPEELRAVSSLGGAASAASGKAHRWTSDTAKRAAQISGAIRSAKKRARIEHERRFTKFGWEQLSLIGSSCDTPVVEGQDVKEAGSHSEDQRTETIPVDR